MMKLKPNETGLRGVWRLVGASVQADEVCERIEDLISNYLIEITVDESGWEKLFQDPEDKRYWELTYPESELHGGGPPYLRNLTFQQVKEKYRI